MPHTPFVHVIEQHCDEAVQAVPFPRQTPASLVPASDCETPPSLRSGGRQTGLPSSPAVVHTLGAQHVPASPHDEPAVRHVDTTHTVFTPPSGFGKHAAPLQH